MKNVRKETAAMGTTSTGALNMKKAVGAVAAAGVALGGLAVVAPDADAQAYGQTCDLVLNTDAPNVGGGLGDQHWRTAPAQMSDGTGFNIPVYVSAADLAGGGGAISTPFAPMSSASMAAAAAGRVICVVGQHQAIINGGRGNDTIYGGSGDETINGGGGNDVIFGNGGDDVLIGKAGDDSLSGGAGNDILFGDTGRNDDRTTGTDNDTLNGGDGNDLIRGDDGADIINGNNGDDCLLGGHGNDEIYGWNDNDTIGGGAGSDYLAGNDNNDLILGGKGNDTLRGNDGLDQIWGDSDLFDQGIEMTVFDIAAGNPASLARPLTFTTPNGNTAMTPRVFVSMGELEGAKFIDAALGGPVFSMFDLTNSVQITTTIGPITIPDHFIDGGMSLSVAGGPTRFPGGVFGGTAMTTFMTMRITMATFTIQGGTAAVSTLAAGQVFSSMAFSTRLPAAAMTQSLPSNFRLGDPLDAAAMSALPIMGPLVVPPNKYDTINSSNAGGIEIPFATASETKLFVADMRVPKRRLVGEILASQQTAFDMTMIMAPMWTYHQLVESSAVTPGVARPTTFTDATTPLGLTAQFLDNQRTAKIDGAQLTAAAVVNYQVVSSSGGVAWSSAPLLASTIDHIIARNDIFTGGVVTPVLELSNALLVAPRPALGPVLNVVEEVLTVPSVPHFRSGHLEVAACNIDGARMIDDSPVPDVAFSGVDIRGLAAMHQSMVLASARGDVEVPLLNNQALYALGAGPGPSGAFLDWPAGVDNTNYDDDIRGGDSDDLLYGEAGSDTVWGDHGDDTIWGEGDNAAFVLAEAAFNLQNTPANAMVGGVAAPVFGTKRKLPAGVEPQYTGAAGNDSLSGNLDDDSIEGGPGNDQLYGGPDDDHLIGDAGSDRLDGADHWDACEANGGFVSNCEILL